MVAGFLFSDGSRNITSWLVLPVLHPKWDIIATYSWGRQHFIGYIERYAIVGEHQPKRVCVAFTTLDVVVIRYR
jgi:hypothetical protein